VTIGVSMMEDINNLNFGRSSIEINGRKDSGKSALAYYIMLNSLSEDSYAFLISTKEIRVGDIVNSYRKCSLNSSSSSGSNSDLKEIIPKLRNIYFVEVDDLPSLFKNLSEARKQAHSLKEQGKSIAVFVVDEVTAFLKSGLGSGGKSYNEKMQTLVRILHELSRFSAIFDCFTIVTNSHNVNGKPYFDSVFNYFSNYRIRTIRRHSKFTYRVEKADKFNIPSIWKKKQGDDRLPSKEQKDYWLHSKRKKGFYPLPLNGGKWLVFLKKDKVDEFWLKIKEATENGELGDYSKVSTLAHIKRIKSDEHVIYVHTYNWKDEEDVRRVRQKLRELGVSWSIPYKTDRATRKKIFSEGVGKISKYYE